MTQLQGKHALVTGGGTGIGLAIAKALADKGAEVTITGRRRTALEAAAGPGLHPVTMDVTQEASVIAGVQAARSARGPIAIVVANAGLAEGRSLRRSDAEFWRTIMATNLDGAFHTLRACVPDMVAAGWGRAIAISSIAGLKGLKGAAAYTASKHGLVGLMRGLAADHLGTGVTFNALCPGYVDTDIVTTNLKRIMERTGKSEVEARKMIDGANPHGQLIAAQEIAAAALWLCASPSVNGQAIQISGGEF